VGDDLRTRLRARASATLRWLRRVERREVAEVRDWLANTDNLLHLTVLAVVPALIAAVTFLSETVEAVSFLLFPPLAAGTYTLFADPGGRYADPRRFVGGLTLGAACGVAALELAPAGAALSAALAVFLTAVVTWAVDVELPTAFSTALLVLVNGEARVTYLAGMAASALVVAGVFVVWRRAFYERRARYLYDAVRGDDHVLVPLADGWPTVALGARLAAAHDAGKVVLLDVVRGADGDAAADRVESTARRVRETFDLPCEAVVAAGDTLAAVRRTAETANCDLVAVDFDAPYARDVLAGEVDAVALRSVTDATSWDRVLVMVARPGDSAHAMIDFAERLAADGRVSVCTCIGDESERRGAESRLANLVETASGVETRVSRSPVGEFVRANAAGYDLVLVGASGDRSRASRLVVPPLFEQLDETAPSVDFGVVSRR
jgi:hypothetical protein